MFIVGIFLKGSSVELDYFIKSLYQIILLSLAVIVLIWSGINPKDQFTWILEVAPSIVGLPLLWFFNRKYQLNKFFFTLVCLHSIILCVGGHYTYAEVPIGFWARDFFEINRNHFDRLGHLFQGVTPALVAYFILSSKNIFNSPLWLKVSCVSFALSFSVFYEFIEWWTSLLTGEDASAFLGTQGDPWDTQWDMFMALLGASMAMFFTHFNILGLSKTIRD